MNSRCVFAAQEVGYKDHKTGNNGCAATEAPESDTGESICKDIVYEHDDDCEKVAYGGKNGTPHPQQDLPRGGEWPVSKTSKAPAYVGEARRGAATVRQHATRTLTHQVACIEDESSACNTSN